MTCIPEHLVCDGRADCEDRSDEKWTVCKDRVQNCVNGTFACAPTKQCQPSSWRCDGRVDCPDRSDEKNCEPRDCDADHFQCLTGQCIPLQRVRRDSAEKSTNTSAVGNNDASDEVPCVMGSKTVWMGKMSKNVTGRSARWDCSLVEMVNSALRDIWSVT
ncbi:Low-density lipoprotein receptor domain class A, partial [Teladorsagia circumcincta]